MESFSNFKASHCLLSFLGGDVWERSGLGSIDGLGDTVSTDGLWGVDSGSLVLDVSNEAVGWVGVVGDDLDAAVGKVDAVFTLNVSGDVLGLGLVEVGTGVTVLHTVLVSEGLWGEDLLDSVSGPNWWGAVTLGPGHSDGHNSAENDDLEEISLSFVGNAERD